MKIVIDGRLINESGIGRYLRNLIGQLQVLDSRNEYFILLLQKDLSFKLAKNFQKVEVNFRWYTLQEQLKLPGILKKINPDLVHFPHFNVPIFYSGKFVVTIHDLIHQHYPTNRATTLDPITYRLKKIGYGKVFSNASQKSSKILTPSNFVKNQLIKEWNIDVNKIVVTPEAVDDKIFSTEKIMNQKKIDQVIDKFKIKQPYIFYVGNAHPHKNVEGLIEAFLNLRQSYQYLQLVLSGHDHFFWERLKKKYENNFNIIFTGFVFDEELQALYAGAKCFVMPSREEGFGLPILEAFAASCPVVSSSAGSLLEVGGDAALYFDSSSQEEMVEKIQQVLNSEKLRNELIKKGQQRVKQFSWQKMAKQTMDIYNSIL
ncbi:MAG: glycosyltransferase family 1 protein [Candidatus Daviesbacteria bacterium]|nr:glycosyltransferase family 1 protein [Candidatus Daviesbacteria bacterium]